MTTTETTPASPVPGRENYDLALGLLGCAGEIPAHHDETNPAAAEVIAEAQVRATMATWEALADIADTLTLLLRHAVQGGTR